MIVLVLTSEAATTLKTGSNLCAKTLKARFGIELTYCLTNNTMKRKGYAHYLLMNLPYIVVCSEYSYGIWWTSYS